jgi:hypothetical protein
LTTSLPLQKSKEPAWPNVTPAIKHVWQSTLPTPSMAQQALALPNMATMLPTVWAPHSDNKKDQQEQACQLCHTQQSTSI